MNRRRSRRRHEGQRISRNKRQMPTNQRERADEDVVDRWPSGPVRIGPPPAYEAAVPAQDGARGDQAVATQALGQPPGEGGEDGSVRPVQAWSRGGAAEYGHFGAAAREVRRRWWRTSDPAAGSARAPAGRSDTTAAATRRDRARASERADHRWLRACATFWNPTRSSASGRNATPRLHR